MYHRFNHQTLLSSLILTILIDSIAIKLNVYAKSCEKARLDCSLRIGCGFALQNYLMECTDLIAGRTQTCDRRCEHALIGLISTDEGKELMNCNCNDNKYCEISKSRLEICRKPVWLAIKQDTIVSCSTARWICITDQPCRTALEYYELNCNQLFQGQKCTYRCNNSLSILDRQEKAMKLRSCYCDGTENFPCRRVKYYTEHLCYERFNYNNNNQNHHHHFNNNNNNNNSNDDDNRIEPIGHFNGNSNINNINNRRNNYHRYRIDSIIDRIRGTVTNDLYGSNYSSRIELNLILFVITNSIVLFIIK